MFGKTGLPFQMFRYSRKSSHGTTQNVLFHLVSTRIFRKRFVNGKQPFFPFSFRKSMSMRSITPPAPKILALQCYTLNSRVNKVYWLIDWLTHGLYLHTRTRRSLKRKQRVCEQASNLLNWPWSGSCTWKVPTKLVTSVILCFAKHKNAGPLGSWGISVYRGAGHWGFCLTKATWDRDTTTLTASKRKSKESRHCKHIWQA